MYQARNFLNARNVSSDVNACEEFLQKYSEALILSAYNHYCKNKDTVIDEANPQSFEKKTL